MKKRRALKIILLALAVIIIAAAVCVWSMFGAQLKAAGTIERLEDGVYTMEYVGDYGFDAFLA